MTDELLHEPIPMDEGPELPRTALTPKGDPDDEVEPVEAEGDDDAGADDTEEEDDD